MQQQKTPAKCKIWICSNRAEINRYNKLYNKAQNSHMSWKYKLLNSGKAQKTKRTERKTKIRINVKANTVWYSMMDIPINKKNKKKNNTWSLKELEKDFQFSILHVRKFKSPLHPNKYKGRTDWKINNSSWTPEREGHRANFCPWDWRHW